MRILIADENESDRTLLHTMLRKQGDCELCTDGTQAIETFSKAIALREPFNLVCLDIAMPDIDGKEVLKKFRSLEKEHGIMGSKDSSVIVITTGNSDMKQILSATKLGCNGYLTKPINQERLYGELGKLGVKVDWSTKPKSPFKS